MMVSSVINANMNATRIKNVTHKEHVVQMEIAYARKDILGEIANMNASIQSNATGMENAQLILARTQYIVNATATSMVKVVMKGTIHV